MGNDFHRVTLTRLGKTAVRLGLSATYRPGTRAVHRALDAGVNFFFCFGIDGQMIRALREQFPSHREECVLVTGAYNLLVGHPNLRRTLEKRLRQLHTDYLDAFLFLGVTKPGQFSPRVLEELQRFREEGKVRSIGLSTHDRVFAGELAARDAVDVLMVRYNAAHRGAEQDIFPHLQSSHPVVVSYTATRWHALLERPRGWPAERRVPTAGLCYRFVLSNPHVDVCLMAPANLRQLEENLALLQQGPLDEQDMVFMRAFGDAVYRSKRWFM